MDPSAIAVNALWAGLFAAGLAVTFTAPARYLVPAAVCGAIGRSLRDVCVELGLNVNWATVIAAAALTLLALAMTRRHQVAPVVLISAVLPLGAAVAMFDLIFALMRVSSAKGEALTTAALALSANAGKVFAISLAVAVGLAIGMAAERLLKRDEGKRVSVD